MSTPFRHLVGFFIWWLTTTRSFGFFGVQLFKPSCSQFVCAKSTWKSSAAAIKEIPKGEFYCLKRNSKTLFVSKAKNLDRICLVEKVQSVMATKCFHLATSSFNEH